MPKRLALVDLYEELAEVLHIPTRILRGPAASCASSAAGLSLVEHQDQLQVVTAPSAASWVARFLDVRQPEPLSRAALEVLVIVDYEQPITRADTSHIRSSESSRVVDTLVARGLIADDPRFGGRGRPCFQ